MKGLMTHRGFMLAMDGRPGYLDLPLVDKVYHQMETQHNVDKDYEYVKDVLAAAKQVLFDKNGRFILAKQLNSPVSRWVFNFSVSTLAFISGEPRKISLENYRDLLAYHPKDIISTDASEIIREQKLGWLFDVDASVVLSRWLSREDGLTDLVVSMYLVAGSLPDGWFHHTAPE